MNNNICREECWSAISKSYEAIGVFMASIKPDSDNYVGGIEKLHLEEALSECRKALKTRTTQAQRQPGSASQSGKETPDEA